MKVLVLLVVALLSMGCTASTTTKSDAAAENESVLLADSVISTENATFSPRYVYEIPVPKGYERVLETDSTSFEYYLQHLPLMPQGTPVHYYDGGISDLTNVSYAVIDGFDLGNRDLQQCADFVIRLRAEWLYSQKRYNDIAFHFTNGWLCEYKHWAEGERVAVNGNKTSWYKTNKGVDYSYKTFREYLDIVFNYAGTLSLSKELVGSNIKTGTVFINGGSPGHAAIVVDYAKSTNPNSDSRHLFVVAEGYMPAQDPHIILNTYSYSSIVTPWFGYDQLESEGDYYYFPTYCFSFGSTKRFR